MISPYLFQQFSGPLAQGTIDTVLAQYQLADDILSYWYGLSISSASAAELTAIGYLVGLPWPTAPDDTFSDRVFTLGTSATFPLLDPSLGLSDIGVDTGGYLTSSLPSSNNLVPIQVYRQLLVAVAIAKYQGLSYATIDLIVSSFGNLDYMYISPSFLGFTFGSAADYPQSSTMNGFSGVGLTTGGLLSSDDPSLFPDSDVTVAFTTFLSSSSLWVLREVFLSVCTAPQVFIRNGI